jgi:ABC-type glycerol-3-phosphate transport system substrate-binding protein
MPLTELRARIEHLELICAIVCLSVVFPFGCKGTLEPTPEPATITFIYRHDLRDHIEEAMVQFYKQYPHITVDLRAASDRDLAWHFDADDADVRAIFTAIVDSQRERGDFLALDPFIEADGSFDVSDFYPAALEAFTIDGRVWAIPYGVTSEVVFYNKDLFDQYGVPYPEVGWTWDDFVRSARALRDPQADIYGFAHTSDAAGWFNWTFIHQHGGRVLDDIQNPTRVTFDDPLTIEAMEWYARLYHEYGVAPTREQVRRELGGDVDVAFANDQVGMTSQDLGVQGDSSVGKGRSGRWGIVTVPRSTADTALDICGDFWVNGYAISSETEYPKAAWRLVAFMSRQMPPPQIPPRRSLVESGEYEQLVGGEAAAVARDVLENGLPWPTRRFLGTTRQAIGILGDATAKIISGEMTSQEAMGWAQQEAGKRIVIEPTPTPTPSPTPPTGQGPPSQ